MLADNVLAARGDGKTQGNLMAELNMLRFASAAYGLSKETYFSNKHVRRRRVLLVSALRPV